MSSVNLLNPTADSETISQHKEDADSMATTMATAALGPTLVQEHALTFYFAGGLFNVHQLAGNASIAAAIERQSKGRYVPCLPQHIDFPDFTPHGIRDSDLKSVIATDCVVVQFDGAELDSGTVAEFMTAKFADVPVVAVRSDFRAAGDQKDGDPWNLMLSNYPRTATVSMDAMAVYQQHLTTRCNGDKSHVSTQAAVLASEDLVNDIAIKIIAALDLVAQTKPTIAKCDQEAVYRRLVTFAGFKGSPDALQAFMMTTLTRKQELGLL